MPYLITFIWCCAIIPMLINASLHDRCPKLQVLLHNLRPTYNLDIGESIQVWAKLIPEPWEDNRLFGTLSNATSLAFNMTSTDETTSFKGVIARNVTVFITHKGKSESNLTRSPNSGEAYLHLEPFSEASDCGVLGVSSTITVGCHPNRNIKLRDKIYKGCDAYKNLSYVIPRDHMKNKLKDKVVNYDFQNLGCPIKVKFTKLFWPTIDLYDGNQFSGEVQANYVLWEQHARTGYKYSATMKQAGCTSEAQTWHKLMQSAPNSSAEVSWTRENYQSCFEDKSSAEGNLEQEYEILNSSGISSLEWKRNGLFTFKVTIVDPNYSFCHLTSDFAVLVHGTAQGPSGIPTFLVLGTSCIALLLLLVTAYYIMSFFSDFQ